MRGVGCRVTGMRYEMQSIERTGPLSARAFLIDSSGELIETTFTIEHTPVGDVASPEPDVFSDFGGSAEDVRAIVAAVTAFVAATPWTLSPDKSAAVAGDTPGSLDRDRTER